MYARVTVVALALTGCGRLGFDPLGSESGDSGGDTGVIEATGIAVVAGSVATCAVRDGRTSCWGHNGSGLLANGADEYRNVPALSPVLDNSTSLALGDHHGCAVRPDGEVWCWGDNGHHELGDMEASREMPSTTVPLPARAVQVAVGDYHSCARLVDGDVWCWGKNWLGQVGDGAPIAEVDAPPTRALVSDVVQVVAAGWSTCARRSSGDVWCWGRNESGQLGRGVATAGESTPARVVGVTAATSLTLGGSHGCVVEGGAARCWGDGRGALGSSGGQVTPAVGSGYALIRAGSDHTCAQRDDGRVSCWGSSTLGQLGDGMREASVNPVTADVTGALGLTASGSHTCVARADDIKCWGSDEFGQIGDGRDIGLQATRVVLPEAVTSVSVGDTSVCASSGANIYCWGDHRFGHLGSASAPGVTPSLVPVTTGSTIVGVTVSGDHACVLDQADDVWCWGDNGKGALGDGTTDARSTPVPVAQGSYIAIEAGYGFTCGVGSSEVRCWGYDADGRLGTSTSNPQPVPTVVPGLDSTQIAVGAAHVCVSGGTAVPTCWGNNGDGQLGIGTKSQSEPPSAIGGGGAFVKLAAGDYHTCATDAGDALSCWGWGGYGQTGPAGSAPQPVATGLVAMRVDAGGNSTCIIDNNGTAQCFGNNYNGQLGDLTLTSRSDATTVAGLPSADEISIGATFACALATGEVWCWGSNLFGQLGRGTTTVAASPLSIQLP